MRTEPDIRILERALLAIEREAGLRFTLEHTVPATQDRRHDATVQIDGKRLFVAVKKWAQHANVGALIDQLQKLPERGLLVADFVNPRMAEKLRAHDVQFIDTAGNAFINTPPAYIYIRGNRPERATPTRGKENAYGRAFATTGLKVVFTFLCNPDLVNAPYREVAQLADAAVGTVGWVLNDLKENQYVADLGRGRRRLINYQRLLDRWTEAYPQKLRPKQLLGVFCADQPDWWRQVAITDFDGYWGGETAAAKLTRFKPEMATVYLRGGAEHLTRFVAAHKLRKATQAHQLNTENIVHVFQAFWHAENLTELVDPVLVYADLIATVDARNREIARDIFAHHIARRIRQD
jgi:hypothetical protein